MSSKLAIWRTALLRCNLSMEYIADMDLYKTVRPYYVNCSVIEVPEKERTNIETVWKHDVPVHDVRGIERTLSFEKVSNSIIMRLLRTL